MWSSPSGTTTACERISLETQICRIDKGQSLTELEVLRRWFAGASDNAAGQYNLIRKQQVVPGQKHSTWQRQGSRGHQKSLFEALSKDYWQPERTHEVNS